MIRIILTIIFTIGLLSIGNAQASLLPKVDLFDVKLGKVTLEIENSYEIQSEVEIWLQSIIGIADRTNILEFQSGYCLRIPTLPMQLKNEWIDTVIQDVFLMLDPTYDPMLLIFDVKWPNRGLVHFSHDVRPFLKKLGIWEVVKSSFPLTN